MSLLDERDNRTKKELGNTILQEENEVELIDKICKSKMFPCVELGNFLKTEELGVISNRLKTLLTRFFTSRFRFLEIT